VERAEAAAAKALALDPSLAEAHNALGIVRFLLEWKWAEAERSFQRALELNPGLAQARSWYGLELVALGRLEEATKQVQTALELDPFEPIYSQLLGVLYHFAGDDERAFAQLEETLVRFPVTAGAASRTAIADTYQTLGMMNCEHGRFERGFEMLKKMQELSADAADRLAPMAYGLVLAGRTEEARQLLGQMEARSKTEFVPPTSFALVYAVLGDEDEAFGWLERAYEGHWVTLPFLLAAWPPFDPLRKDPRFDDLLRRMGLPRAGAQTGKVPTRES